MKVCSFTRGFSINVLVKAFNSTHLRFSTSHEWKFTFGMHHAADHATARQLEQTALERGT